MSPSVNSSLSDLPAPWRTTLIRALHRNRSRPYSRYAQLATIRPDGFPANRTVVFRGFLEMTDALMFVTDSRSEKINQIQQHSQAELCWYFHQTREQFRITGRLQVTVEQDHPEYQQARRQIWERLSDPARMQFTWPPPHTPRDQSEMAFNQPPPDARQPPATFALLILIPLRVDHLELRGDPQNRTIYSLQTDSKSVPIWCQQAVNP